MARASTVARTVRLFADRTMSQAAMSALLAREARGRRDALVQSGDAPPAWRTFVDGVEGASEDTAQQAIVYRFNLLQPAVTFALTYCVQRSPVRSGAFRSSWFVAVDGKRWTGAVGDIPAGSQVMICNDMPYARKVDVGGMKMSVPPGIVEGARQAVQRQYPTINASRIFTNLSSGTDARGKAVPYILKGQGKRKDTRAGQVMTYPALLLTQRL